ncbi:MAG: RagB/SusD family nutrient uptake outer membrane protein [Candidatus Pseudobacter hemicellulosilyticus]|uniref:RagB/SusD family nutrient uptake outer membrane protein n=1 Tax=Candidatus Pseudobacter hemicellulosilyticus TaxID=3121375 RepID=A0AAJ5WS89_9BACT|nr:MAG: RagB/SusD family nutrient uptake outer membrane protein [Pseudobacter sp.]
MKLAYILPVLGVTLMLGMSSCSKFLDVDPESKIPGDKVFSDINSTNAYVLGLYDTWREGHKARVDPYLGTDEAISGGFQHDDFERRGLDEYAEGMNSTNGKILSIWTNRYQIISRSAPAIQELKRLEAQGNPELNKMLGEASLLRAVSMWELSQYFGSIPVIDHDKPELGGNRQPLDVVYTAIEEDLLNAEKYLPDPSAISDPRRASKALAQAMLGKLFLYAPASSGMRDYEKAKGYFKKVIDNPYFGTTGASNFAIIFNAEAENETNYKREMIYAFQYKAGYPNQSSAQWDVGSRAVAQMTPVEAIAPWSGFDGMMASEYCYGTVANGGVWEAGDLRKDESIRYDFTWNGYTPNLRGWAWGDELEPHIKKYEDLRIVALGQSTWHSGKSIPFIRFSDVVLNYAECLYFTGQQAEGISLINNVVRKRAFGGTLPAGMEWSTGMGTDDFLTHLLDERMRELCFEGWRKFDLLRTGKLIEYVTARNRWVKAGNFVNIEGVVRDLGATKVIPAHRLLWPIPLEELRQNPDLDESKDQNPGY